MSMVMPREGRWLSPSESEPASSLAVALLLAVEALAAARPVELLAGAKLSWDWVFAAAAPLLAVLLTRLVLALVLVVAFLAGAFFLAGASSSSSSSSDASLNCADGQWVRDGRRAGLPD